MKLFYTRFDGRAQNTNAKISSYFSKFLRFYYERLYFSLFEAFGSLRVNSNIELFWFRQVTDVAVFSASRWFIFNNDYQEF